MAWKDYMKDYIPMLSLIVLVVGLFISGLEILGGRLDRLESSLGGRMDRLDGRMGQLEDRLGGRMDRLGGRMDRLGGRMDRLESKMDGLDGRMDGLSIEVVEIKSALRAKGIIAGK